MESRDLRIFILRLLLVITMLSMVIGFGQYRVYLRDVEVQKYAIDHDLSLVQSELQSFIQGLSQDAQLLANSPVFKSYLHQENTQLAQQALYTIAPATGIKAPKRTMTGQSTAS